MITYDSLTISLATLTLLRVLGVLVFIHWVIQKKEIKYIILTLGWLVGVIGTAWGLFTYIYYGEMDQYYFSLMAGLGTFLLGCGAMLYFDAVKLRTILIGSIIIIIYGLLPLINVKLFISPGLIIQLSISILVAYAVVFKRKIFIKHARSSYYWLLWMALFSVGLTLLFIMGIIGPSNMSMGFAGTTVVHMIALIFFLHLEYNLSTRKIYESENRYRFLFDFAPVALWEEDISGVMEKFTELKISGVQDIRKYANENPAFIGDMIKQLKILDVNREALVLHNATEKKELFNNLEMTFAPESINTFFEILIALFEGDTEIKRETILKTLQGEERNVVLRNYSSLTNTDSPRSLVSITDITEHKRMESELKKHHNNLQELIKERTAQLEEKNADLQSLNDAMIDREFRMKELSDEVETIKSQLNE